METVETAERSRSKERWSLERMLGEPACSEAASSSLSFLAENSRVAFSGIQILTANLRDTNGGEAVILQQSNETTVQVCGSLRQSPVCLLPSQRQWSGAQGLSFVELDLFRQPVGALWSVKSDCPHSMSHKSHWTSRFSQRWMSFKHHQASTRQQALVAV